MTIELPGFPGKLAQLTLIAKIDHEGKVYEWVCVVAFDSACNRSEGWSKSGGAEGAVEAVNGAFRQAGLRSDEEA